MILRLFFYIFFFFYLKTVLELNLIWFYYFFFISFILWVKNLFYLLSHSFYNTKNSLQHLWLSLMFCITGHIALAHKGTRGGSFTLLHRWSLRVYKNQHVNIYNWLKAWYVYQVTHGCMKQDVKTNVFSDLSNVSWIWWNTRSRLWAAEKWYSLIRSYKTTLIFHVCGSVKSIHAALNSGHWLDVVYRQNAMRKHKNQPCLTNRVFYFLITSCTCGRRHTCNGQNGSHTV